MKLAQQRQGISLAAAVAAASGNIKNFMAAMTEGGIEAQEKTGQMEQAALQSLPLQLGHRNDNLAEARKSWESLGFKFGNKIDDCFCEATFPKGWTKKPIDHNMWTEILDEKGRRRGMIFYKAAFYDRSARANLSCRFSVDSDYEKPYATVRVKDACSEVEFKVTGLEAPDYSGDRAIAERLNKKQDEARAACLAYLNNNFPRHESPLAYWDGSV